MKTTIKRLMLSAMMIVMATSAIAQDDNNGRKRMTREQLAERQAKHIAHQLAFDNGTTEKFVAAYTEYHKELWALRPQMAKKIRDDKQRTEKTQKANEVKAKKLAEKETDGKVKRQMERSKKLMALKEKYYDKYAEFLSTQQIDRVYEIEKKQMRRLSVNKRGKFKREMKRGGGTQKMRKARNNRP